MDSPFRKTFMHGILGNQVQKLGPRCLSPWSAWYTQNALKTDRGSSKTSHNGEYHIVVSCIWY
jgi:hypothetical protein